MFYCALQQLVSHTAGEQSPNNWASSGAARPSRPQDAPHSTADRRHLVADGPRPAALKPSHASRPLSPAVPLLATSASTPHSYWLADTSVKRRAWLRIRPAGPPGRPSGAFRRRRCACARPQCSASRGAARSCACALQSRLPSPPPPSERKWWGRGSSVSALFALDKMAKIAKTHEGKRLKSARGGAL